MIPRKNPLLSAGAVLVVFLFTFAVAYPFFVLALGFFRSGPPLMETWRALNAGGLLLNSLCYSGISALVSALLGLMAGFALSKFKIRGAAGLWIFFSFGIFLVLQPLLVPLRQGVLSAGLYDSRLGVLIPYLGLGIPLGVCLGTEFVRSIPDGIIESALLDGAGYFRIFRGIILPMALPGGALIAALVFTLTWNEYLLISVLSSPRSPSASLNSGLAALGAGEAGAAALVIGLAPGLIIFLFLRKYFFRAAGMIRG